MMLARIKLLATAAAALALFTGSTGCVHSPYGMSLDRHNYTSTPHTPLTLTLVDTMTGETVWSIDVPMLKKVVIDVDHDDHWTTSLTPTTRPNEIRWGIFEPDQRFGVLTEKQKLSGNPVVLKVSIREKGEAYTLPIDEADEPFRNPNDLGQNPKIDGVTPAPTYRDL